MASNTPGHALYFCPVSTLVTCPGLTNGLELRADEGGDSTQRTETSS